jgi:hypothetical protein
MAGSKYSNTQVMIGIKEKEKSMSVNEAARGTGHEL